MNSTDDLGPTATPDHNRPRTAPIIWGAIFLAFCAWVTQRTFFPDALSTQLWLIVVAIGLGVLLLGVGVAVGLRDRRKGPTAQ